VVRNNLALTCIDESVIWTNTGSLYFGCTLCTSGLTICAMITGNGERSVGQAGCSHEVIQKDFDKKQLATES
jgi:hypothetical protein